MLKISGMRPLLAATICSMAFDADAFMGQSYDGELDTVIVIPDEGDYRANFSEFTSENGFRTFEAKKGNNIGKEYTVFEPPFVLADDPRLLAIKTARGTDVVIVRSKGVFLDLTDQGALDFSKGKNVDLGRMRDAVGQNQKSGWKITDLIGQGPVMVRLIHEKDPQDETKKYARISRVIKIS